MKDIPRHINNQPAASNSSIPGGSHISSGFSNARENNPHLPWIKPPYAPDLGGLQQEIMDFYSYYRPSESEQGERKKIVDFVDRVAKDLWPESRVEVTGSTGYGISLSSSDLDTVILGNCGPQPFDELCKYLKAEESITRIEKVPHPTLDIVNITLKNSNIDTDISIGSDKSVMDTNLINAFAEEFPPLRPIVYLLKHLLRQNGLNKRYTGGLSSYSITLLTIFFLQRMRNESEKYILEENLGLLFMQLLEFISDKFDFENNGVSVRNGGNCVQKMKVDRNEQDDSELDESERPRRRRQSVIYVEDPIKPDIDVTASSYRFYQVQQLLGNMNFSLTRTMDTTTNSQVSLLGEFIHDHVRKW